MRVEILEARLSTTDPETGRLYVQEAGDTISVPDALGKLWCSRGWARDVDGTVPTGERTVRGAVVLPKSARHAAKDSGLTEG